MDAELYQSDESPEYPEIEEQNGSSVYEDPLTPPFIADAVKMAALYHIRRIQELIREDMSSSQVSLHYNTPDSDHISEKDRLLRLRMVRGMLMTDISQLFQRSQVLEQRLINQKTLTKARQISIAKWMGGVVGLLGLGIGIRPSDPRELKIFLKPGLIFLNAYIAYELYSLSTIKRSISYTKLVRQGLLRLANHVRGEEPLEDEDIEFLQGEVWTKVPWKEVEDSE